MRGQVTQHDHMAADKKVGGVHMMDGQCRHGHLLPRDQQPPRHRQVQCQHSRHPSKAPLPVSGSPSSLFHDKLEVEFDVHPSHARRTTSTLSSPSLSAALV